jgi:hypothetical protein
VSASNSDICGTIGEALMISKVGVCTGGERAGVVDIGDIPSAKVTELFRLVKLNSAASLSDVGDEGPIAARKAGDGTDELA